MRYEHHTKRHQRIYCNQRTIWTIYCNDCMGDFMLTYEQQKEAVTLAMQIETGTADLDKILNDFQTYPNLANNLVHFWWFFNDMTRNAIAILVDYKSRKHLERCLKVS